MPGCAAPGFRVVAQPDACPASRGPLTISVRGLGARCPDRSDSRRRPGGRGSDDPAARAEEQAAGSRRRRTSVRHAGPQPSLARNAPNFTPTSSCGDCVRSRQRARRLPSAMIDGEEGFVTTDRPPLLFGFNTPPGDREMGRVDRATFAGRPGPSHRTGGPPLRLDLVLGSRDGGRPLPDRALDAGDVAPRALPHDHRRPQRHLQLVPSSAADGKDVGEPQPHQRRPVHPRLRSGLAGARVPGVRLGVPLGQGAHRPDGRGGPAHQDDVDRVARPPSTASTTAWKTRSASRAPTRCRRS